MSKKLFLKSIAVITSTLFIATNLSWANLSSDKPLRSDAAVHAPITSIQIPEALGSIQDQYISAPGSPFVVLIQDAHAVTEAQIQIQKLIQYLGEKYGISLAALEGTSGKMDATLLRAFPDGKVKEKVLSEYLSRGEITGAEMAAIFNAHKTEFFGIEDMKLYEENYFAYLSAVKNQKSIFTALEKSKSELDSRRKTVYSAKHDAFYLQVESFRTGKTSVLDLFKYFRAFDLKKYPNLKKICDLSDQEITKKNIHQISDIKGTELFGEMENFISETENSFCGNQEQKDILEAYRQNVFLRDMASLELTKEQWVSAKNVPQEFTAAADFYRLALRRDNALHANLNQLLVKQKAKSAIVIAGGFHAEGFKEALKKSGYSYAVVLPALHSANGHENYAGLMQGNLSYKQYLKTSLYDAFSKDASIKLSRALDPRDAAQKMKYWRDEVIRMTARQGRVGDAGKYTRYIDSLNTKNREEILASVRKVLDTFLAESLQKMGAAIPVFAKSSALIYLQAHPLMPEVQAENRILKYLETQESGKIVNGRSLGALANLLQAPTGAPEVLTQKVKSILTHEDDIRGLVQAERITGVRYEVINPEHWIFGAVLKLTFDSENGLASLFVKLPHSAGRNNPTREEYEITLEAAKADIVPQTAVIDGALITRGIDRGESLAKIFENEAISKLLFDDPEHFMKEIGKVYGKLNKQLAIAHGVIYLRHIFITSDKKVYLIDFSTLADEGKISTRILPGKLAKKNDWKELERQIENWIEPFNGDLGKTLLKQGKDYGDISKIKKQWLGWLKEGYDSVPINVSAHSLGEGDTSKPDDKAQSASVTRAPPSDSSEAISNPSFSAILEEYKELDDLMTGLNPATFGDAERLKRIEKLIHGEETIFRKIVKTASDKGTAFPVIVEQAEDQIFGKRYSAQFGLLSIPMVKANKIGETYALKGFADALKGLVNEHLIQKDKTLAFLEDPERPQSGYMGTRIVIMNILPEDLEVILPNVIEIVLEKIKDEFLPKVIERKKEQFLQDLADLHFYASHAKVYLPNQAPEGESLNFEMSNVTARIEKSREERLKEFISDFSVKKRLTPDDILKLSDSKRRDYYRAYDEFLGDSRRELSNAAKYWVEEDKKKVTGARGKASSFIELLLEDGFKKLYERLEALEKVKNDQVRKEIGEVVGSSLVSVLDDDSIKKIKERSRAAEGLGAEELSILFRHLQEGREKTIPSFNFLTGRFPRILAPLKHIYPIDKNPSTEKINKTYLGKLKVAFTEFLESKDDPEEADERLRILMHAYRDYRISVEEAMILAYRDPRLEQIYKVYEVDEVIEADEQGLLEAFDKHIRERAQKDTEWARQHKILLTNGDIKFRDLSELIHPGLFIFKRPNGDETGFVVRHEDGTYHEGFAELNNGNAYFEANQPDSRDSVYHQILIDFQLAAEEYLSKEGARKDPLKFMDGLNDRILHIAPQLFPTTVKVEGDGLERMAGYALKGDNEPLLHPKYAVSSSGLIYVRQTALGSSRKKWLKTGAVTIDQLTRFMVKLSASRIVYSHPIKPGKDAFLNIFQKLDTLVGIQKQTELVLKVAKSDEVEEIRDLHTAASAATPRPPVNGKSLGSEEKKDKKSTRPVVIRPRKKLPDPDRLQLFTSSYKDLFRAILGLFNHQRRAAKRNPEGIWEGFFKIVEDGDTVDYAVYLPGQEKPYRFLGEIPRAIMAKAELILIQNSMRSTRPGVTSGKKVRLTDDAESVTKLRPDVVRKVEHQFRLEWKGIAENLWWLMFNPFSIWPQKSGKPLEDQPHHLTISRADGIVSQKEMSRKENLLDIFKHWMDLNDSESIKDEERFRLSVNGWYYSDSLDAVKAGASQSQAHAHLVRFSFPIERAPLLPRLQIRNVEISELADGWGSGIVLEAPRNQMVELADLLAQTLKLITSHGHSFNIITTLSEDGKTIRVFVADRVKNGPEYFDNEWGFSEFSRVVIVDNPLRFYKIDPALTEEYSKITDAKQRIEWVKVKRNQGVFPEIDSTLRADVIKSLNQVTAPREHLNQIFEGLKTANQDEVIQDWTPQAGDNSSAGASLGKVNLSTAQVSEIQGQLSQLKQFKGTKNKTLRSKVAEAIDAMRQKGDLAHFEDLYKISELKEITLDEIKRLFTIDENVALLQKQQADQKAQKVSVQAASPRTSLSEVPKRKFSSRKVLVLILALVSVSGGAALWFWKSKKDREFQEEQKQRARKLYLYYGPHGTGSDYRNVLEYLKQIVPGFPVNAGNGKPNFIYVQEKTYPLQHFRLLIDSMYPDLRGLDIPEILTNHRAKAERAIQLEAEYERQIDTPEKIRFVENATAESGLTSGEKSKMRGDLQIYVLEQGGRIVHEQLPPALALEGVEAFWEREKAIEAFRKGDEQSFNNYWTRYVNDYFTHEEKRDRAWADQVISLFNADPGIAIYNFRGLFHRNTLPGLFPSDIRIVRKDNQDWTFSEEDFYLKWRAKTLTEADKLRYFFAKYSDSTFYGRRTDYLEGMEPLIRKTVARLDGGDSNKSQEEKDKAFIQAFKRVREYIAFKFKELSKREEDLLRQLNEINRELDELRAQNKQPSLELMTRMEELYLQRTNDSSMRGPEVEARILFEALAAQGLLTQDEQSWLSNVIGGKSLGEKVDGIYRQIEMAEDIPAYVASTGFEHDVTKELGNGASVQQLVRDLRVTAPVTVPVSFVKPVELSSDAKFLLANPKILAGALKNKHGIDLNLKSDYVIDASFLHQTDAVKFIQQLGVSAVVTFASGTPDADLASKLRGTRRIGYGHNNILDQKKLRGMANPTLILPAGISFKFSAKSDWKKRGVEAAPSLINPYETSEFVRLVKIILQTRKLTDNGVSFPVIDQEMLNSVVTLLNNLAKEEFTREAIGRAA